MFFNLRKLLYEEFRAGHFSTSFLVQLKCQALLVEEFKSVLGEANYLRVDGQGCRGEREESLPLSGDQRTQDKGHLMKISKEKETSLTWWPAGEALRPTTPPQSQTPLEQTHILLFWLIHSPAGEK